MLWVSISTAREKPLGDPTYEIWAQNEWLAIFEMSGNSDRFGGSDLGKTVTWKSRKRIIEFGIYCYV